MINKKLIFIYDALEKSKQELIEAEKQAIKLNALSKKQQASSNESGESQPKMPKECFDVA